MTAITYKKVEGISCWNAKINGELVGKLVVENNKVYASDHTIYDPKLITGKPLDSLNQGKAILEAYFQKRLT